VSSFFERKQRGSDATPADLESEELRAEAAPAIAAALGASWYERYDNAADRAVVTLCRLRRAYAGRRGEAQGGDEAVRTALAEADPEAVVWLASRLVSYMDEQGYPESLAPWLEP
jgi:hypothetical protein